MPAPKKKPAAKKPAAKKPRAAAKPKAADVIGDQRDQQAKLEREGHRNIPPDVAAPVVPPSSAPAHAEPEVDPALAEAIRGDAGDHPDAHERGFLGTPPAELEG